MDAKKWSFLGKNLLLRFVVQKLYQHFIQRKEQLGKSPVLGILWTGLWEKIMLLEGKTIGIIERSYRGYLLSF